MGSARCGAHLLLQMINTVCTLVRTVVRMHTSSKYSISLWHCINVPDKWIRCSWLPGRFAYGWVIADKWELLVPPFSAPHLLPFKKHAPLRSRNACSLVPCLWEFPIPSHEEAHPCLCHPLDITGGDVLFHMDISFSVSFLRTQSSVTTVSLSFPFLLHSISSCRLTASVNPSSLLFWLYFFRNISVFT